MKKILWSILLMFGFMINVSAINDFELSKTINKNDVKYGRDVNVTLEVKASPIVKDINKDIVFVIDRSSSMNSEMSSLKEIMKKVVDNLVNDKTRIGLVIYGTHTISTKELSNNKEEIKKYIDLIPNIVSNEGTNIDAGIRSSIKLLEKSNYNKTVILLTDGEPTFYYEDNNGKLILKGNGINYSFKAEESAKKQIDILRENKVSVYNIGFKIKEDSNASKFLKKNSDKYYNPKNIEELQKDLNNINEVINIISTNNKVIDIVPNNFKIKNIPSSVKQEKSAEGIILTWDLGEIDSRNDYKLTYTLEAIDSDYGSMYTNEKAVLTGNFVKSHPLYSEANFELYFDNPVAPIPMVTKDDNYIEKQTEILEISKDNGILSNDSFVLNNDKSESIKNKFNISNLSCGKNLKINENGSFSIETEGCDEISFEYSVTSYIKYNELVEVESNKSKVNIKLIPKNSYVVKYLNIDNNEEIIPSKIVSSYLNEQVEEEYVNILYYTLVSDKKQSIIIQKENNEIIFYYKKNVAKYSIEYYYDNVLDANKTEVLEDLIGKKIEKYPDKIKDGYELSKTENLPLIVGENDIIKVYYTSKTENIPNTSINKGKNLLIYLIILVILGIKKIVRW